MIPVVPVDIVVADVTGDEGTGLEFTVTLNNAVAGGFDVSVNFTDGTATGGEDYADDAVTLTFLGTAGETQTFTVATFDDAVVEGAEAETFTVSLSASHANVNDSDTAVGRIIDNDSDNNIITQSVMAGAAVVAALSRQCRVCSINSMTSGNVGEITNVSI